ncbi:hypothetical protein KP509_23G038800 [Ceratopteris richardii]|uniref:FRIGIDA-like protein n=1 Tax=Ceratopteris richardii TaxID=49495 RepID=A0A8T2S1J5_CERRI|nr:hypothetical protein KP509_23G038800 [Ceratopteris richardii]
MASPAIDISSAVDSLLERKEKLHKAFSELESKKAVLTKLGIDWNDVDAYLFEVEKRLRNSVQELVSREAALDVKIKESSGAYEKRAADVSSREEASLARIQDLKDEAIAIITELQSTHDVEGEDDTSKDKNIDSEDHDEVTDAADPEQTVNRANDSPTHAEDVTAKSAAENGGKPSSDHAPKLSNLRFKEISEPSSNIGENKPRRQLKTLCEAMEADNLRSFIAENRKDLNAISAELPFALKLAEKPASLVLRALEGYGSSDQNGASGNKKDAFLLSNKRACVIMLEALAEVLAKLGSGVDHPVISEDLKKSAKEIADLWKSNINLDGDINSHVSTDAQSFLQLLATFGLASEYNQDELCKLIIPIARRKQTPSLCRSLNLSAKVPDLIEELIKDGKQLEAITFATEFGLLERFQPVPLLKAYLKEAKKAFQNTLKAGNNSTAAQNDANQKELSALKVVLKTITDLKLEESYPPSPLEKRVAQLEKAKADRKRSAASGKPQQMKRPRTNSGAAPSAMGHDKSFYRDHRAQYGDSMLPYGGSSQSVYDRHALGAYNAYSTSGRSPVNSYLYPSDGLGSFGYGAGSSYSTTPSASYSGYGYGAGLPSTYQSYH